MKRDISTRHIDNDNFVLISSIFGIFEEEISDGCLFSVIEESDDFLGVEILSNKS